MQPTFTTRPDIRGTFGAVATTHWLATQTGMAVLERGGNAFDAACAAGFVLQIVEPHLNGPGGELPAIVMRAGASAPEVICGQGTFPAAATAARLAAMGLEQMPGTGLLPAVVPGAFDGWMLLLARLRHAQAARRALLRDLLCGERLSAGAAHRRDDHSGGRLFPDRMAELGRGVAGQRQAAASRQAVPHARDRRRRTGASSPKPKPRAATAFAQIEAARSAYYKGFVAEAIDRFYKSELMDSTGTRHRGLLTGDDLAHYAARVEKPVSVDYHGLTVHKIGPWSQGPMFLQTLRLLEGYRHRRDGPARAASSCTRWSKR